MVPFIDWFAISDEYYGTSSRSVIQYLHKAAKVCEEYVKSCKSMIDYCTVNSVIKDCELYGSLKDTLLENVKEYINDREKAILEGPDSFKALEFIDALNNIYAKPKPPKTTLITPHRHKKYRPYWRPQEPSNRFYTRNN